jgi:hypothetical protein
MRIFPENKLFSTHSKINDDLKRGNTTKGVLSIYRYLASCNQKFKIQHNTRILSSSCDASTVSH